MVLRAHPTGQQLPCLPPSTSTTEEEMEGLVWQLLTYPLHVVCGMDVRWAQLHKRVEDLVQHL